MYTRINIGIHFHIFAIVGSRSAPRGGGGGGGGGVLSDKGKKANNSLS